MRLAPALRLKIATISKPASNGGLRPVIPLVPSICLIAQMWLDQRVG